MSLVRSADPSTKSYGESKIYTKGNSNGSALSTHMFRTDEQQYGIESFCFDDFNQQYFCGSPPEELYNSPIEFLHQSNLGISAFGPKVASSYQLLSSPASSITAQKSFTTSYTAIKHPDAYQSDTVSEYFDEQSPVPIDYDEEEIRLKLQELERALLNDNDDYVFAMEQRMDIDCEWGNPIKNLLLPNSPRESSSSDSNLSIISSNKEMLPLPSISSPCTSRPLTPKQLIFECAAAIAEGNTEEASSMITELRQLVSIQGDPSQRIAAYMVEGLAARMAASGKGLYKALKCKEPPTSDRLSAMQILFEVCPCFKFGFMAANGMIVEAFRGEERVHIIDFDIQQGSQYITLIQALASCKGKPSHLRITGVDDPESVQRAVGGLKIIGQRLEKLAEAVGLPLEFRAIAARTSDVTPLMLNCRSGEALVVNFAFQLHHIPDESVSIVNQRDQLLRMVKSLGPKLVTMVEQDMNTNTAPFYPRFIEAYNYYSAVFESLDATLPRDSPDRMNVERQCLAKDIVNIVACEGEERIERYEVAGKWRARMTMAGFTSCPLSPHVNDALQGLIKEYCDKYKVKVEQGALHFGWENKVLIVTSAWK